MKSIIALIALIALSSAQLPVPIPSVSLSVLSGEWYVVWTFDASGTFPAGLEYSCYQWDVSVNSDGGNINADFSLLGNSQNYTIPVEIVGSPNTVWDETINWIALDPVSQSWATVGLAGAGNVSSASSGYILSRTPTLSNLIINANIALLTGEQFPVSSTNQIQSSNTACPSASF